ncbi:hypothetical protein C8R43DRAFT_1129224 [Mycena crocata]|nr:hypothetical protein C8R43DRAFT_1129224 [Mycena crocata]
MASLSKCVAEFGLVDPKYLEDPWKMYFTQRQAAVARAKRIEKLKAEQDIEELNEYMIYYSHSGFVDSAVRDVLECTSLDDSERKVVRDGIFLLRDGVERDEDNHVPSADVMSRIYSPTTPTAVDVYMDYWHKARQYGVEFTWNVYYRVHNPVERPDIDVSDRPDETEEMFGFRPVAEMDLEDVPKDRHWRVITKGKFIPISEARMIHSVLFGVPTEASPGLAAKVSMREMLWLLFASVGIALHVASDPTNKKDREAVDTGTEVRWVGLSPYARWLGRNIRRVGECAPMPRDGEDSDVPDVEYD